MNEYYALCVLLVMLGLLTAQRQVSEHTPATYDWRDFCVLLLASASVVLGGVGLVIAVTDCGWRPLPLPEWMTKKRRIITPREMFTGERTGR